MEKLEKYITDERTGLKYELIGDYYFIAGDDEQAKQRPIGIWGQQKLQYIREHKKLLYSGMLLSGKLNDYLADINDQAEDMFFRLVKQMAEHEGITEQLKAENQMEWVTMINNIHFCITEIVNKEIIYH